MTAALPTPSESSVLQDPHLDLGTTEHKLTCALVPRAAGESKGRLGLGIPGVGRRPRGPDVRLLLDAPHPGARPPPRSQPLSPTSALCPVRPLRTPLPSPPSSRARLASSRPPYLSILGAAVKEQGHPPHRAAPTGS